jgi:hypothetical protein
MSSSLNASVFASVAVWRAFTIQPSVIRAFVRTNVLIVPGLSRILIGSPALAELEVPAVATVETMTRPIWHVENPNLLGSAAVKKPTVVFASKWVLAAALNRYARGLSHLKFFGTF